MNSYGTWATDAGMMAIDNLLGIDIVVHSKVAECISGSGTPASSAMNAPMALQSISKPFQCTVYTHDNLTVRLKNHAIFSFICNYVFRI